MDLRSFRGYLHVLRGAYAFIRYCVEVYYRFSNVPYTIFRFECVAVVNLCMARTWTTPISVLFFRGRSFLHSRVFAMFADIVAICLFAVMGLLSTGFGKGFPVLVGG